MTNEKDSVCVPCKKFGDFFTVGKAIKREGVNMSNNHAKEKICVRCKNSYAPNSNVQQFCPACGKLNKAEKNLTRKSNKKHPMSRPATGLKKVDNIGGIGGSLSESDKNLKIDLSHFPVLADRVTQICEEELRFAIREKLSRAGVN